MKKRPLTYVGAFLLLIVALVVAIGNFKPETKTKHQPLASQQVVQQHTLKPRVQSKNPNKQSGTFVITTKATMGLQQQNTEQ